ncbi:amidohydrolase family protein [Salinimicrobium soli]|uniref:amidohydrolase family protein n=1 Tax=Salinimicrobium soli TaxID=1254399 RepID=UPI003AAAAA92
MKTSIIFLTISFCSQLVFGQLNLPIIDMQLHAHPVDGQGPPPVGICTPINPMPVWDPAKPYSEVFMKMLKEPPCSNPVWSPKTDDELMNETLDVLERLNIYGVLSGQPDRVAKWRSKMPDRLYPAIEMSISPNTPSTDSLRNMHKHGNLMVLGELTTQYAGISPDDERLEPYFKLAEELDIPVGIHVGPGPPGVIYLGATNYRARMHSPLSLEEVLVKHPKLRLYIMHGGYPMIDDLLTLLYAHPQVHLDIGVIVFTQPREAFYNWLKAIFDAGFGNRVMFGSDQMVWPGVIERSIEVINKAPFLSESQKRDIFYNNAARFLRLSKEEIARHHGK